MGPSTEPWYKGPEDRPILIAAVVLLLIHGGLAWLLRSTGLGTGDDHTEYVLLSRSLRHLTYRDLFLAGTPPHAHYPPLHPALLAAGSLVLGESMGRLVILGVFSSTATLGFTFLALRRIFSPRIGLLCLLPLAVNPLLLARAGTAFSEPTYGLLVLISLWALAGRRKPPKRLLIVGGAAVLAAALTRSIGLSLVVAFATHWLLERRFRAASLFGAAALLTVGVWSVWTVVVPDQVADRSYFSELDAPNGVRLESEPPPSLVSRWKPKLFQYLGVSLPDELGFPTVSGTPVDNAVGALLAVLFSGAGLLVFLKRWRPAGLYLIFYGLILGAWPWHMGRFLEPLIPLTVPAALLGIRSLLARMRRTWAPAGMAVLALVFTATGITRLPALAQARRECDALWTLRPRECLTPDQASFLEAARYLRDHSAADDVVLTAKAAPLYYYSGVRTVPFHPTISWPSSTFLGHLRSLAGSHVLLASLIGSEIHRLHTLLKARCSRLELVRFFPPRTYLFRLREEQEPDDLSACAALDRYKRDNVGRDPGKDRRWPIPRETEDDGPTAETSRARFGGLPSTP